MKKLLAMLAVVAFGFSLAACGEQDNRTKVTFWHTMGKENQVMLEKWIAEFEKAHPDIRIDHAAQGGYDDINDKLKKAIPANTYPTMAFAYPDHVADYLGKKYENSKVVPLNDLINDPEIGVDLNDYVSAYLAEGLSYGTETYYSMPYSKSTEVLFYNKTFFDAQDPKLVPPTTWAEFEILAAKIKTINKDAVVLGYDSGDNLFITMAEQHGNPYTSADPENHYLFNVKANHDMVKMLDTWYDNGWLTTKDMLNGDYTSNKFKAEDIYLSVGSTGGTKYNIPADDEEGKPTFDAAVAPLPQVSMDRPRAISQGPSICFFKQSDEQVRAAWEFYKYITNAENSAEWALSTGYNPVNTGSYEVEAYKKLLEKDDLYGRVARVTKEMDSWYFVSPAFRGSSTSRKQVGLILTNVFSNKFDIEKAFKNAIDTLEF